MTAADCWDRRSLPLQSAKSKSWRLMCISRLQRSKPRLSGRDRLLSAFGFTGSPDPAKAKQPLLLRCSENGCDRLFETTHQRGNHLRTHRRLPAEEKSNTPISPMFMTAGQEVISVADSNDSHLRGLDEAEAKRADVEEPPPSKLDASEIGEENLRELEEEEKRKRKKR